MDNTWGTVYWWEIIYIITMSNIILGQGFAQAQVHTVRPTEVVPRRGLPLLLILRRGLPHLCIFVDFKAWATPPYVLFVD